MVAVGVGVVVVVAVGIAVGVVVVVWVGVGIAVGVGVGVGGGVGVGVGVVVGVVVGIGVGVGVVVVVVVAVAVGVGMTRSLLFLTTPAVRQRAAEWALTAPHGSRLELKGPKRTTDQNSRLWAMLTDVADQMEHEGRKYSSDQWKAIFMSALGREVEFIPSLDGKTFIPWGQSSSDLSKAEMSELIEFVQAWGVEQGIIFQDMTGK